MTTPSHLFVSCRALSLRFILSLALLCGLATPSLLHAQPAEKTEKPAGGDLKTRYGRAVTLYNSGQYDKAIEEFQAVYEMRPEPILLFNLAQAHRKAGHKQQALDLYERFLRESSEPDPKLKSETDQYITELRTSIASEKEAEKAAAEKAAAEKAAAEKAAAEKAAAEKAVAEQQSDAYRRQHGPMRPLNIAKWTTLGAGVVMLVIGAALVGVDGRPVCSADMPQVDGQKLCPNELDTRVGGGVLLGLGVASLATSGTLFLLDYKQTRDSAAKPLVALNVNF